MSYGEGEHQEGCRVIHDGYGVCRCKPTPSPLTREQCSLCTANRPRLCDHHYKQGADELLKQVTDAIQDSQTPGGVKATYEQLLDLCRQQRHALAQQAQEIERLRTIHHKQSQWLVDISQAVAWKDAETLAHAVVTAIQGLQHELTMAQARVKELELDVTHRDRTIQEHIAKQSELQATLAAREGETPQSVAEWANCTFGPATIRRQVARAKEEWVELEEELYRVMVDLGHPNAINEKMAINRSRTWNVRPDGTAYHVKPTNKE